MASPTVINTAQAVKDVSVVPPTTVDHGWTVAVFNVSPHMVLVTTPAGTAWLAPFTVDVYGSGCDSYLLRVQWGAIVQDFSTVGEGYLYFVFALEPDWIKGKYPQKLSVASH